MHFSFPFFKKFLIKRNLQRDTSLLFRYNPACLIWREKWRMRMMSAKGNSHQEHFCFPFSCLTRGAMLRSARVTGRSWKRGWFQGQMEDGYLLMFCVPKGSPVCAFFCNGEWKRQCVSVPRTDKYVADSRVAPMFRVIPCPPLKSVFVGIHAFWDSYQDVHKYCSCVLKGRGGTNWKRSDECSTSPAYHFLGAWFITADDLCQQHSEPAQQGCHGDPARDGESTCDWRGLRRLSPAGGCRVTPGALTTLTHMSELSFLQNELQKISKEGNLVTPAFNKVTQYRHLLKTGRKCWPMARTSDIS